MKTVSKKTLKKSFLNWFFWNGCSQQAETMLGMAFGQSMAPVIDELYETKEDKAAALQRHITQFNTETQLRTISNAHAAIGDSLWVATIIPLLLTICLSIASAIPGSAWVGALLYMIIYPLGTYLLSWKLFNLGYKAGLDGVQRFMASGELDRIMQAITVLGLIVVGALTASFVTCNLNIDIKTAAQVFDSASGTYVEGVISVFNLDNLLNNVFPHIVPLALTLGVYNLYTKKNWTPLAIMGMILVLAAVLTAIGYIPAVGAFA